MARSDSIRSYKQHKLDPNESFDAIVIGSGMGGLTCAALLARDGERVLVLEKHYTAGGFTHVFKRSGYEWDVGIHYIGGVNHPRALLYTLFHYLSRGELEWADMGEIYDRVWFGDEHFDFRKGAENFKAGLKERFPEPEDQQAIDRYVELVKQANEASRTFFAEKAVPRAVSWVAGGRMRKKYLDFAGRTTREVLEELTRNEKLIGVLTAQYGDYGLPPGRSSFAMHALVSNHYLHGGAFPVGGSSRIAETVAETIGAAGGLVLTNAPVESLILERNAAVGVRMADGRELRAPNIISSAGVVNTYRKLVPEEAGRSLGLPQQLDAVQPSVAHMGLYLGFKESTADLGLNKTNYWIYPDGSYDHDKNVEAFVADVNADFPVVYVSFPSAKDPKWEERYPGRATVDIITLAPYEWFDRWKDSRWKKRGDDYEAFKEQISQRLLEVLYRYEPQLRGKVDHYELSTPLSTRDFVSYELGEIYGLSHDPARFEQRFLRPRTPIKNLYLTGQDIVTCGVGGALLGGMVTVSAMKGRDYISKARAAALQEIEAHSS
ncbi:FAD-dependent oxidoreductase [Acidobacteria bacterium Mor1]|nr:FAD-dependent oxidoreductase [Acidobacteria bacterium Mor1]